MLLQELPLQETTNWKYDFEKLPYWNKYRNLCSYDGFYEGPENDILCCLYSINEVRMGWYWGYLAILKYNQSPNIILNLFDDFSFFSNIFQDEKFNLYFYATFQSKDLLIIIDIKNERISYICPQKLVKGQIYSNIAEFFTYNLNNIFLDNLMWFKFTEVSIFKQKILSDTSV